MDSKITFAIGLAFGIAAGIGIESSARMRLDSTEDFKSVEKRTDSMLDELIDSQKDD